MKIFLIFHFIFQMDINLQSTSKSPKIQDGTMENPWNIQSIYELQYFNCPSCVYINRCKQDFVNHAYEFHPESNIYLAKLDNESINDIICPWDVKSIKTEEFIIGNLSEDPLSIVENINPEKIVTYQKYIICQTKFHDDKKKII